ncbi:hypothetical protein [Lacibacter sediminis]|jgi:hypothetical protein|uniref:Uncharacterized protein n=1 Tax=Lacibacter sediminis TaxID=2760713 RepID=A0A7G5XF56_9BACT|nr:hypothetical protein [Lacibacter sediminis]QNA44109.1 hypothetical protein H4075_18860 [Lacibacter sediminis]
MKQITKAALVVLLLSFMTSCNVFKRTPKEGCPTNGKNVGAEKLLSGEKVKKAKRFNS